ncbi:Chlamydia CHLPS protein (DUF818) [Chlamydia serpentis]|uniref:Chlamydia CHLPS protein (DUF818) n=1 Tax=Chlamydia serpentis TaxID=1967782 RepID=A0A2R8FCB5_9CHLA|nr:CPn0927/CPn0928 family alpha/beta hydrolase fold protein [Chlamydia serpentis]SPN74038.1 Chlamydia CHLPS protein (DUF818) [Chlamydia serpentis]
MSSYSITTPPSNTFAGDILNPSPPPKATYFSSHGAKQLSNLKKKHPLFTEIVQLIVKIFKILIGLIILPLGIYWLFQSVCANRVLPYAPNKIFRIFKKKTDTSAFKRADYLSALEKYSKKPEVAYIRRTPIEQDNILIDTLEISLQNAKPDRWLLISLGNDCSLEEIVHSKMFVSWRDLAKSIHANILIYNYPEIMSSTGTVDLKTLGSAHNICAKYLKDTKQGCGAKEIITYGYSLGGLVQSEALRNENLLEDKEVRWVAIKDRCPLSIASAALLYCGKLAEIITNICGWGISTTKNSFNLPCPEIFIYPANPLDRSVIQHDNYFPPEFTLAHAIKNSQHAKNKYFIGEVGLSHTSPLDTNTIAHLSLQILDSLSR